MGFFRNATVTSLLLAMLGTSVAPAFPGKAEAQTVKLSPRAIDERINDLKAQLKRQGVATTSIDSSFMDENFGLETRMFEAKRRCPGLMNYEWFRCEHDVPSKIERAPALFQKHKSLFEEVESRYGLNVQVGFGMWAIETNFSESKDSPFLGRYNPFNVLVTLYVFTDKKKFAVQQLVELYKWVRKTNRYMFDLRSSYMGAIGILQFLPLSLNNYYVGRSGDIAKADPFDLDDAIFSMGNYLIRNGWDPSQKYITRDSKNWNSILRYNRWDCYVMGVLEIGDSLRFADIPEMQQPLMPASILDPGIMCVNSKQTSKKRQ